MLERIDRIVTGASWLAAAIIVLMLVIGPRVIAEDEPESATGGAIDAQAVFTENCGSCHTLSAAGTSGQVGPSLDETSLDATEVEAKVQSGGGVMPAFDGVLSPEEIAAVAAFVGGGP